VGLYRTREDFERWARRLLKDLAGRRIQTLTGRVNRILRVETEVVVVATAKSPAGRPVPIAEIADAMYRLCKDREIEISVPSVGYRSAFVGAVLRLLPGAVVSLRPRRIRLESHEWC
jgi:hypothetical protein